MSLTLNQDNDVTLAVQLQTTGASGRKVAATALTVTGFISASSAQNATALHSTLSVALTETAAGSGYYAGVLLGASLTAQWAALVAASALWVHYVASTDYHEVDSVVLVAVRVTAP